MKKLLILFSCVLFAHGAFAWGQKGHDVTAYIAECHLTPEAAEKIDKALNGHSPVYYANWLDIASHTPEYAYTKTGTTGTWTKARRSTRCRRTRTATC